MLLEPIYEQEFKEFSFGFRPGRSAHDGLEYLWKQCMDKQVKWILDVDIRSYFDTLDHAKLREIVSQRVQDGVVRRLIGKWLNRRSRQDGGMSWQRFEELIERYFPLPAAKVVHSIYAAKS